MSTPKKTIKIFLSSPMDVAEERFAAKRVIERLQEQFAYYGHIEAVLSEEKALPATEAPQKHIPAPSDTDIVVVLLWSRLGTPILDEHYRERPDDPPMTGTEWEFYDAAKSYRATGRPFLLVYRKIAKVFVDLDDKAELERRQEQKRMLEEFERRWFRGTEGAWKGYYHPFATTAELEALLEQHLSERLRIELADDSLSDDPIAGRQWLESPFRGLAVFDVNHSRIFCGRAKALSELRAKLKEQIAQGVAFILVAGASGAGKSSLVRAGLVASLLQDAALVADNGLARYAIVRPSDGQDGFGTALIARLSAPEALPELKTLGFDPLALPERLCDAVAEALARAAQGASLSPHVRARLILVVDQLEELFTGSVGKDEANRFILLLDRLARSGHVWVIATLRGDFFSRLDDVPKLSELAETGLFRLAAPQAAEIAQMIRKPAELAGIRFERHPDTRVPLDSLILEEAADDPASLPLLEFTLDELWRRRTAEGLISYEAYERLGGLSGGIARRAEEVVRELEKNEGDIAGSIDAVLETLVTIGALNAEATAATARYSEVANTPDRICITDCLIAERLVVTDVRPGEANPVLRLAHERLIQCWPRLAAIVRERRDFLVTRARLKSDADAWVHAGEPDDLLVSSPRRLDSGRELLVTKRDRLDPTTARFLECSLTAADARRAREADRERERVQLELDRQQAVNKLQASALKQAERRTRTIRVAALGVAVLFGLVIVSGVSWNKAKVADAEKRAKSAELGVATSELKRRKMEGEASQIAFRAAQYLQNVRDDEVIQWVASSATKEFERVIQSAPDNLEVRRIQADTWKSIAQHARDVSVAIDAYEKEENIRRPLATESIESEQDLAHHNLSVNLMNLGERLESRDRHRAALVYNEALEIARRLAIKHSDNIAWQFDVPSLLTQTGALKWREGDQPGANSDFQDGLNFANRIADTAKDENINWCRCRIAHIHEEIGEVKLEGKDWFGALKSYEDALGIRQELHNGEPNKWQVDVLKTYYKIIKVKLAMPDSGGALETYKQAQEFAAKVGQLEQWDEGTREEFRQLRETKQEEPPRPGVRAGEAPRSSPVLTNGTASSSKAFSVPRPGEAPRSTPVLTNATASSSKALTVRLDDRKTGAQRKK
jgi:Novel STAND NTPase 1